MAARGDDREAGGPPGATQTWLDPGLAAAVTSAGTGGVFLCACATGDLAFSLAISSADVEQVICVAPDAAGRALAELQLAGARALPVEGLRNLLGLDAAGRRVFLYHQMRGALSEATRAHWDAREGLLREGILEAGAWDRHLARFRRRALPLLHESAVVSALLSLQSSEEAAEFLARRWETTAWRLGIRAWFASPILDRLGIPGWARWAAPVAAWGRLLRAGLPATSPFLHRALRGAARAPWAPHLGYEGHARLAAVADRVRLEIGPTEAAFARLAPGALRGAVLGPGSGLHGLKRALSPDGCALVWGAPAELPPGLRATPLPPIPDRCPVAGPPILLRRA